MRLDYDVAVVGAGIAGCMAATAAAVRSLSLRIILLDRNPKAEVGKKTTTGWICGDAVGEHHVNYIRQRLGITYGQPEIENRVTSVLVFSPDGEVKLPFEGPGYVLDRPAFARRLLDDALRFGVEFKGNFQATSLIARDGHIVGVQGRDYDGKSGTPVEVAAKLVIDASGIASKLRRELPVQSHIEREIDRDDIELSARMIAALGEGISVEADHCDIYLDQEKAPGGYLWVFPKSRNKVNIGLGIQQRRSPKPLRVLFDEWLMSNPLFKGLKPLAEGVNMPGSWQVSVRHQNDCLVANGYMITGDAAWFPNPISAGGIGPGLIGGLIAGEVAAEAVEAGDFSEQGLWQYNLRYLDRYGKKTAALEAFRVFLQSLSNEEINYGMRYFLSHEEAIALSTGQIPHIGVKSKLAKAVRGLGKLRAFKGLVYTISRMRELNALYGNYPKAPKGFPEWKRKVDRILSDVRARFG